MEEVKNFIILKLKRELNNIIMKEQIDKILEIINTKPLDIWKQENSLLIAPFIPIITENGKYKNVINNAREIVRSYYQFKPVLSEHKDKRLLDLVLSVQKFGPYVQLKLEQAMPNLNPNCTKEKLEKIIEDINNESIDYKLLKKLKEIGIINEEEYKENLSIINTSDNQININKNIVSALEKSAEILNSIENNEKESLTEHQKEPSKQGIIKIIIPDNESEETNLSNLGIKKGFSK